MGTTPKLYPIATQLSGTLDTLTETDPGSGGNFSTQVTIPALSIAAVTRRFVPRTTQTANATVPTEGTAYDGVGGWRATTDMIPLNDAGRSRAGSVTFITRLNTSTGSVGGYTLTLVVYAGTVEIGRGSFSGEALDTITTAGINLNVSVTFQGGITIPAGARITMAAWFAGTNGSPTTASQVRLITNYSQTYVASFGYSIDAARAPGELPGAPSDGASREVDVDRFGGDTAPSPSDSALRTSDAQRPVQDSQPSPAASADSSEAYSRVPSDTSAAGIDTTLRRVAGVRRVAEAFTPLVDTTSRTTTLDRRPATAVPAPTDSTVSTETYPRLPSELFANVDDDAIRDVLFRRSTDQVVSAPTDSTVRLATASRQPTQAVPTPLDEAIKLVVYGRTVRYQAQPGDEPLIDPTKDIEGVVRDAEGTVYLDGALVILFRADTNIGVQSTTSSTVDGSYSFPRNSYDTYQYFVAAWSTDGTRLQAVTERTLTAV